MLLVMAGLLFAGLAAFMRNLEAEALRGAGVREEVTAAGTIRPLADIAELLRQSKLVTVEVRTYVSSEISNESWRGGVTARVDAPARLLYGSDLSRLEARAIAYSPVAKTYLVRIPPPERIASEIFASDEEIAVQVGWLRLRSRAGEYYLGLARRALSDRAREVRLSAADAERVRQGTLEQVAAMVQSIVGERVQVQVDYDERGMR
jgi:hypothetical protein